MTTSSSHRPPTAPRPAGRRRSLGAAMVAAVVLAGAVGCLRNGADYSWRGDLAVLRPHHTRELVRRYDACGRNWACTTRAFYGWNFHEKHFFDNRDVADSFRVHEGRMGLAVRALDAAAADPGLCIGLPAMPGWEWSPQPC